MKISFFSSLSTKLWFETRTVDVSDYIFLEFKFKRKLKLIENKKLNLLTVHNLQWIIQCSHFNKSNTMKQILS